jgi:hypothetical protein
MTATNPLARIPSELADQWNIEEREHVQAQIRRRQELLAITSDEEADIDQIAQADEEAETILVDLNGNYNVTPEMLIDDADYDEPSLFEEEPITADSAGLEPLDEPETKEEPVADAAMDQPATDEPPADLVDDDEPAGNADDPRADEIEELSLPGVKGKPGSRLSRKVALEGKFIGKGVRLTHEVTDPDAVFRLMAECRLDHNSESPQRDGSGPNAKTTSVVKTQHFRVLRFAIQEDVDHIIELLDQLEPEDRARVREALDALDAR